MRTTFTVAIVAGIGLSASGQQPQRPADTFRTGTRLVPISVVVHDRSGKAVEGLTADDFTITEEGVEHPVALFAIESRAAARATAPALPPNMFSNRVDGPAAAGVTVILFDRLNTADFDQQRARDHVVRFLKELRPDDRVGFYVLEGASVRVLHDFTRDASSLLRALDRASGVTSGALAGSEESLGKHEPTGYAAIDAEMAEFLAIAEGNLQGFQMERRGLQTSGALEAIARHLEGVKGRKNVIWISSGFPLTFHDGLLLRNMSAEVRRATRALSHSDIAIYPVDARGLTGVFATHPSEKKQQFSTLGQRMAPLDASLTIAEQTGGRAFHTTNDLGTAITRAAADADLTYVLGYYPVNEKWDGRFRNIRVTVNRRGLDVRHRRGYFAHPAVAAGPEYADAAVLEALHAPLDATGLTMTASAAAGPRPGSIGLTVLLHPGSVTLRGAPAGWEGSVHLSIGQALPDGRLLKSVDHAVPLQLSAEQRDSLLAQGMTLSLTIDLRPEVHQIRLAARDAVSGAVGSLTIPAVRLRDLR